MSDTKTLLADARSDILMYYVGTLQNMNKTCQQENAKFDKPYIVDELSGLPNPWALPKGVVSKQASSWRNQPVHTYRTT